MGDNNDYTDQTALRPNSGRDSVTSNDHYGNAWGTANEAKGSP